MNNQLIGRERSSGRRSNLNERKERKEEEFVQQRQPRVQEEICRKTREKVARQIPVCQGNSIPSMPLRTKRIETPQVDPMMDVGGSDIKLREYIGD